MSDGMSNGLLELSAVEWSVPFLLLILREQGTYEDELTRRISDFGFEAARPEAVYQTLGQMEEEGMVVAESDGVDGGPPRWRYSITDSGEAYLESWAISLAQYQEEVEVFFRVYADGAVRRAHR